MLKSRKGKFIAFAGGGIAVLCVICIGGTMVMDSLGLLPTSTPTLPPTLTFTPSSTPLPSETPTSTITPVPSDPPTITVTPIASLPSLDSASCVPLDTKREIGQVTEIIDGDTIEVLIDGAEFRVRYIGMDTPERGDSFSDQATNKNSELVAGQFVTLVKDMSETDQYDRLLRYVFVGDVFVNYELVRLGLAESGTWPPDIACDATFRAAEQEAKNEGLGIWVALAPPVDTPSGGGDGATGNIVITNIFYDGEKGRNEPDEYLEIRNDGAEPVNLQGWTLKDEQNHIFRFPSYAIQPGEVCRIYTNENHPESCGFNFGFGGSAIWNNGGDCAYLRDAQSTLIDEYCY